MTVMNIMVMMMTKMVVMIPIRSTLLRSLAQESRIKIMQTPAQAYLKRTQPKLGLE